jgi:hypothetical protein
VPRADGGSPRGRGDGGDVEGDDRGGGDGGREDRHRSGGERDESAACEAAEDACGQTLESLRSMPPAACTAVGTACSGQTPDTATDACKAAVADCRAALETARDAAHEGCGTSIVAACGGHGG